MTAAVIAGMEVRSSVVADHADAGQRLAAAREGSAAAPARAGGLCTVVLSPQQLWQLGNVCRRLERQSELLPSQRHDDRGIEEISLLALVREQAFVRRLLLGLRL